MILTIAIISGILFIFSSAAYVEEHEEQGWNTYFYGAICVLASWYLNLTVGIIFCCIIGTVCCIITIRELKG